MRNARRALVAAAIAVASIGVAAPPASACSGNVVCDTVNYVCAAVLTPCLR